MGGFGDNLRQQREGRGISLEDISASTKISVRLLRAIENEEFDRLPGGVFNVNFVRQYARSVGLDEEKIAADYRSLTAPPVETPAGKQEARKFEWDPQPEGRTWVAATIVLVMLGAAGGGYLWLSNRAPAAASDPAPSPQAAPVTKRAAPPPEQQPLPIPKETTPEPPRPAPEPVAAQQPPLGADAPVRVLIQATDVVWVSAWADGEVRFQITLQPQQTRAVAANTQVRLRVGDAAAVAVTFNGQPQPPLGAKGQVKTALFTRDGMRILAPPPSQPETTPDTPPPQTERTP